MDLNQRITRLLKSLGQEQFDGFYEALDQGLRAWEQRLGIEEPKAGQGQKAKQPNPEPPPNFNFGPRPPRASKYSDAMLRDLAAFGLTPPVTLEELKKARKLELKKYHPDRFAHDPEKMQSANRIVQILGETYERLLAQWGEKP